MKNWTEPERIKIPYKVEIFYIRDVTREKTFS